MSDCKECERLRAIVSAQNDRDMEKARELDEAEALLRHVRNTLPIEGWARDSKRMIDAWLARRKGE